MMDIFLRSQWRYRDSREVIERYRRIDIERYREVPFYNKITIFMSNPCQLRKERYRFGILVFLVIFAALFPQFSLDFQLKQINKAVFNKCTPCILKSDGYYIFADAYCFYNILGILHVINITYHAFINLKVFINIFARFFTF